MPEATVDDGIGIRCPLCSGPTAVKDTRPMSNYVRRRRVCLKDRCGGKITTLEVKHPGAMIGLSDAVVVPRERLRGFCQSLAMLIDPEHADDDE